MSDIPRLLLVDDDPTLLQVMSRSFRRRGFDVLACSGAEQALESCRDFQASHILLDLNMPGLSGLAALPRLLEEAPRARLVVLTGYSSIATAVEAIKLGAIQYLCKPVGVDDIVRAFIGESSSQTTPVQPPSLERLEWEHLQRVLQENDGNISATARALGMHRRTLQRKLQKKPVRR